MKKSILFAIILSASFLGSITPANASDNNNVLDIVNLKNTVLSENSSSDVSDITNMKYEILSSGDFIYKMKSIDIEYDHDRMHFSAIATTYEELLEIEQQYNIDLDYDEKYFENNVLCICHEYLADCNYIIGYSNPEKKDGIITLKCTILIPSVTFPMCSSTSRAIEIPKICYNGEEFKADYTYIRPDNAKNSIFENLEAVSNEDYYEQYKITDFNQLFELEQKLKTNCFSEKYTEEFFKESFLCITYLQDDDNAEYSSHIEFFDDIRFFVDKKIDINNMNTGIFKGTAIVYEFPKVIDNFNYDTTVSRAYFPITETPCEFECLFEEINIPLNETADYIKRQVLSQDELKEFAEQYNITDCIDFSKYDDEFFSKYFIHIQNDRYRNGNKYIYSLDSYEADDYFIDIDILCTPNLEYNEEENPVNSIHFMAMPRDYINRYMLVSYNEIEFQETISSTYTKEGFCGEVYAIQDGYIYIKKFRYGNLENQSLKIKIDDVQHYNEEIEVGSLVDVCYNSSAETYCYVDIYGNPREKCIESISSPYAYFTDGTNALITDCEINLSENDHVLITETYDENGKCTIEITSL